MRLEKELVRGKAEVVSNFLTAYIRTVLNHCPLAQTTKPTFQHICTNRLALYRTGYFTACPR